MKEGPEGAMQASDGGRVGEPSPHPPPIPGRVPSRNRWPLYVVLSGLFVMASATQGHFTVAAALGWRGALLNLAGMAWVTWLVLLSLWTVQGREAPPSPPVDPAQGRARFRAFLRAQQAVLRKWMAVGATLILGMAFMLRMETRGPMLDELAWGLVSLALTFELAPWVGFLLGCRARHRAVALGAVLGFGLALSLAMGLPSLLKRLGYLTEYAWPQVLGALAAVYAVYLAWALRSLLAPLLIIAGLTLFSGWLLGMLWLFVFALGDGGESVWQTPLRSLHIIIWFFGGLGIVVCRSLTRWSGGDWLGWTEPPEKRDPGRSPRDPDGMVKEMALNDVESSGLAVRPRMKDPY